MYFENPAGKYIHLLDSLWYVQAAWVAFIAAFSPICVGTLAALLVAILKVLM